jgi:DNA-binding NtrC family response regulator
MTHILLVSPEKNLFKDLISSFSENQIIPQWTNTAKKATDLLSKEKFDLILVHEQLPDMTGRKLIEAIITINPMINCVVLSDVSKETFHEMYEGLGVLMQFPLKPGKKEADALFKHLNHIRRLSNPLKGDSDK